MKRLSLHNEYYITEICAYMFIFVQWVASTARMMYARVRGCVGSGLRRPEACVSGLSHEISSEDFTSLEDFRDEEFTVEYVHRMLAEMKKNELTSLKKFPGLKIYEMPRDMELAYPYFALTWSNRMVKYRMVLN